MIVVVGMLVVVGAVLGGFTMAGGHVHALLHPSEIVTIGGAALGALIIMSPREVLKDLLKGILNSIKGSPYNKRAYMELFTVLSGLLNEARRNGLLSLEQHLANPSSSSIFAQSPWMLQHHHALEFLCDAMRPMVEGVFKPEQLSQMLEREVRAYEAKHHEPLNALQKTADALPGFGIVAAVLGIVITMGAIDGPVEEVGHKVGAALVGTFLGILLSYGFFAPLAARMELLGAAETTFLLTIVEAVKVSFVDCLPPRAALEQARRAVVGESRLSEEELETVIARATAA